MYVFVGAPEISCFLSYLNSLRLGVDSVPESKPNPVSAYAGIELMTVSTMQSFTPLQSYILQPTTTSVVPDKLLVSLYICTAKYMGRGLT